MSELGTCVWFDHEKAKRAFEAMMTMKKIDISELKSAT